MRRTPRRQRAAGVIALTMVVAIGLSACTTAWGQDLAWPWDEPEPLPTPTATAPAKTAVRKAEPPKPVPKPVYWPLTGTRGKEAKMQHPAVSVKIENSPEARPTRGLEHADIVWEEVVEGGITRFVATYHSTLPDAVEPVRSVRPMDAAIVAPMKGILAYSGGQLPFIDQVNRVSTQSVIMDKGHAGFSRDPSRSAPHNVIGRPKVFLSQEREDLRLFSPPPAQFAYAREKGEVSAVKKGRKAGTLKVRLSNRQTTNWYWDGSSHTYRRSEGGAPSMSMSGARHAARNVVVLHVDMVYTRYTDPSGARVPETKLVGSGEGFVAAEGRVVKVRWKKGRIGAPITLELANGKEARLAPGNTWVELVPKGSGSWSVP
ncbi:DUF3048 domain-containing protein [Myceligenerans pegani]|uniref:DUF3048 domain-containing protein n=1 Tax=Myceligenerans pegani TaxID=2776917 RepID=A0ABR9N607_9MICO|nr:DUF3048 domain-containing protein [Myceligenerans sp. TRM 65318]MBE1878616.1 DUF3048 domain-containing protein [Myceligenerans sp. TRM 65318]MBE3020887.1 DUF3048 domain-containing protein [Myceligenerans sp. TRM 65318]